MSIKEILFNTFNSCRRWVWMYIFLNLAAFGYGQLPKTHLYLGELKFSGQAIQLKNLSYLNTFNPEGYNNQPQFFSYNEVYFSAAADTQQYTDIYRINLSTKQLTRFTDTEKISEFSPTPVPASDELSVIRIETDGKTQTLWVYPKDGNNTGKRLMKDLDNPGYHCWLSSNEVALFLVGEPHRLGIGNIITGKVKIIADNPGRCLKKNVDSHLVFVDKSAKDWILKKYDAIQDKFSDICMMPEGSEDFEILSNGTYLSAKGNTLMAYDPVKKSGWVEISDLSGTGVKKISRITASRDRIVFVAEK
ncbi:MAG: hypothetical protein IPM26_16520 [Saprospiraceae bacterium]|nr:hypothetical protein [Saprospiraceae bacterium]